MQRYFIFLAYDGTLYHGWQYQPNAMSVQEKIEGVLAIYCGRKVNIVGAGRTDTGVHARLMVAHFDVEFPLNCMELTFKFNCLLPHDISVYCIVPVIEQAHARFSARSRTYHYYISLRKNPFRLVYSCRYYHMLDFTKMNKASTILLKETDFGSFCKAGSNNKTNICHITEACWEEIEPNLWRFRITADRFLRNMVRAIVGTLVEVGKGRVTLDDFEEIIGKGDRCVAGESMPARGLFLQSIGYSDDIFVEGRAPII